VGRKLETTALRSVGTSCAIAIKDLQKMGMIKSKPSNFFEQNLEIILQ